MFAWGPLIAGETSGTLGGSALASWTPVTTLLIAYVVVVAALWWHGDSRPGDKFPLGALQRVGSGLNRLTGIPGWAAVAIGQSLFSLLLAGVGFYSDVAWHVALGRDEELFTAPHTAILLGLLGILASAVLGTIVATLDRYEGGWRLGALRVPWSMLPLGALGVGAVSGFPADEVWHAAFGVDVTMWSPTHMLMILGATFVGLAGWLVLADAGVMPRASGWSRFLHGLAAWLTLQGLIASQGEFAFGVPQFAHVFHPIILSIASGMGLVAIRLVLGPGRALLIAALAGVLMYIPLTGDGGPVETHNGSIFVVSALAVEGVALAWGTRRRLRFAVMSGIGVGTLGLAGEWLINQGAPQPWRASLLPEAVIWSVVAGIGAALLGAAFSTAFPSAGPTSTPKVPPLVVLIALVMVTGPIVSNLDRNVGEVEVAMTIGPVTEGPDGAEAVVSAELSPTDAADGAHWFQVTSWQGGGLVLADMEEVSPGSYVSDRPVPVDGLWKTLLRLHRDDELMAAPIWFPADPEIDETEIAPVDRTVRFSAETQFLLRETFTDDGKAWLSPVVHGYLVAVLAGWFVAFVIAVRRIAGTAANVVREPALT